MDLLIQLLEEDGHKLVKQGSNFMVCCPFHDDKNPSCSVFMPDGKQDYRYKCFVCDARGDAVEYMHQARGIPIKEALEIRDGKRNIYGTYKVKKNYVPKQNQGHSKEVAILDALPTNHVARYTYRDRYGKVLFVVQRYEKGAKKFFGQYSKRSDGKWQKGMIMKSGRPLYGLYTLLQSSTNRQVLVVEGEKCADLVRKNFSKATVVSWFGGSKSVGQTDWQPLYGRTVSLCADSDSVGYLAMYEIAKRLEGHCEIKFVLPPLSKGKEKPIDIGDIIEQSEPEVVKDWIKRHTLSYSAETKGRMERLVKYEHEQKRRKRDSRQVGETVHRNKANGKMDYRGGTDRDLFASAVVKGTRHIIETSKFIIEKSNE